MYMNEVPNCGGIAMNFDENSQYNGYAEYQASNSNQLQKH